MKGRGGGWRDDARSASRPLQRVGRRFVRRPGPCAGPGRERRVEFPLSCFSSTTRVSPTTLSLGHLRRRVVRQHRVRGDQRLRPADGGHRHPAARNVARAARQPGGCCFGRLRGCLHQHKVGLWPLLRSACSGAAPVRRAVAEWFFVAGWPFFLNTARQALSRCHVGMCMCVCMCCSAVSVLLGRTAAFPGAC